MCGQLVFEDVHVAEIEAGNGVAMIWENQKQ